jgi:hypothetical protein
MSREEKKAYDLDRPATDAYEKFVTWYKELDG